MAGTTIGAAAYLILERRKTAGYGGRFELAVVGVRQSAPALKANQRAVRIRVAVEEAVFLPVPTPETTITVHAPIAPDPAVVITETNPEENQ